MFHSHKSVVRHKRNQTRGTRPERGAAYIVSSRRRPVLYAVAEHVPHAGCQQSHALAKPSGHREFGMSPSCIAALGRGRAARRRCMC
eukprot:2217578-Prymnesium_polylepis.1